MYFLDGVHTHLTPLVWLRHWTYVQQSEKVILYRIAVKHETTFLHCLFLDVFAVLPHHLFLALQIQYFINRYPSQRQLLLILSILAHTRANTELHIFSYGVIIHDMLTWNTTACVIVM